MESYNRRNFLKSTALTGIGVTLFPQLFAIDFVNQGRFKISLAEWSFHRALKANEMTNLEFPVIAHELGFSGVEFVNSFFKDKARNTKYLSELKNICNNEGVEPVLIMVDAEGQVGHPKSEVRMQTVENHKKWVDAAAFMGCHSIRINARSEGTYEEQQKYASEGLRMICEYSDKMNINIIVENHGGLSSNGKWLSEVIEMADHKLAGTLPDFGNFVLDKKTGEEYDRYLGVKQLMPYAKGVSAKSRDFDKEGNETTIDYLRMMQIVKESGYSGFVGVEYEGDILSEREGIIATKVLLEKVFKLL